MSGRRSRALRIIRIGGAGALLAVGTSTAAAQGARASGTDTVAAGRFRGVVAEPDPARVGGHVMRAIGGTARWRRELDSLDWREKLTVRVTLDAPDRGVFVARAAGPGLQQRTVIVASRGGQAYVPATLAEELPAAGGRWAEQQTIFGDSVVLEAMQGIDRSSMLRGRLRMGGYPRTSPVRGAQDLQRVVEVRGEFAATFDPRPAAVPRTMSDSMQQAILKRALWDAGAHWMDGMLHIRANDSSFSNVLLRGYLVNRWSHVATVDSVSTDYTRLYVRLRGRLAPVTCEADDGLVRCSRTRGR
jgi:hypothetical protein